MVPIAVLAFFFASHSSAQEPAAKSAVLKGQIVADHVGGAPLTHVNVSAAGANLTESRDPDGAFTLVFPGKEPGDTIVLLLRKDGYAVVNDFQLTVVLAKNPDAGPLVLLMCKENEREKWARVFYRLKGDDAVAQSYERQLQKLKDDHEDNVKAVALLQAQRDAALVAADSEAEELARLRPEDTSAAYANAISLLSAGKSEEALGSLDEEKLRRTLLAANGLEDEAKKIRAQTVQGYILRARLLVTKFRFDEAERTYSALVASAPNSFEAHAAYAYFNQFLNHFGQAISEYGKCLEIAKSEGNQYHEAGTLNGLAGVYAAQKNIWVAFALFLESLDIRRQCPQQSPETYPADIAATENNLGNAYLNLNNSGRAFQYLDDSLRIRRALAAQDPDSYRRDVAATLHNLGIAYRAQHRLKEAADAYTEALGIYKELASADSDTYTPFVATTLNNLANVYADGNSADDARAAATDYNDAIKLFRKLVLQNSDTFLPDLARSLNGLGTLETEENLLLLNEACKNLSEALGIYRQLVARDSAAYSGELAATLSNFGILRSDQKSWDEARKAFDEALTIRQNLAQHDAGTYLADVAATLTSLAIVSDAQGNVDQARTDLTEALKDYMIEASMNPERYGDNVVQVEALLAKLGHQPLVTGRP